MTCCSGFPGGCGTIDIHWETNEEFGGVYDVTALSFYSSSWCKFMEAYMYILAQTNYEENYNKYNIFQTRYRRCLLFGKPLIKWIFIQIMEEFHEKYGGAVGSHDIRSDARKVWHCLKKTWLLLITVSMNIFELWNDSYKWKKSCMWWVNIHLCI